MSKDPLDKIYNDLYDHTMPPDGRSTTYRWKPIAGSLMAIAMRLYRTSLSEENFNKMKEVILWISDVEPYTKRKLH